MTGKKDPSKDTEFTPLKCPKCGGVIPTSGDTCMLCGYKIAGVPKSPKFNSPKPRSRASPQSKNKDHAIEASDPRLLAPCGLFCGVCGVYISTRDHNEKFREILGKLYGSKPEKTECKGCMQGEPPELLYEFCTICPIRDCVKKNGYYSCHQCKDWPCKFIDNFPMPVGRKVMARAIPEWRACCAKAGEKAGNQAFAAAQFKRYTCPQCGYDLFRGAKRCRSCGCPVDVD